MPALTSPPLSRSRQALAGLLGGVAREAILRVTQSPRTAPYIQRHGLRWGASRFVAGESLDDCIEVLHGLAGRGFRTYAIVLGENVTDREAVARAVRTHEDMVRRLGRETVDVTMSMKLTQLGLAIDHELAFESARRILTLAREHGMFIRLDMESSAHVDATLRTYRRLRAAGLSNTGVVLQAYLRRSRDDLAALLDEDVNVRLVKGAYLEPPEVAFQRKADVDRNYVDLIDAALGRAAFTAVATHDDAVLAHVASRARSGAGTLDGRFEFQLLHGVRTASAARLVAAGHPVRICVPYGSQWYVYFGRRLAERPANLMFALRSLGDR
jgi:proline dehydrogenase